MQRVKTKPPRAYTVERKRRNGRFQAIRGLVYASRKEARTSLRKVTLRWNHMNPLSPAVLKVGVLR